MIISVLFVEVNVLHYYMEIQRIRVRGCMVSLEEGGLALNVRAYCKDSYTEVVLV